MSAHIFKVTLENTHPPVWRRIVIPDSATFEDLHTILQIAFGWESEHLHNFTFSDGHFSIGPVLRGELYDSYDEAEEFVDDYLDYKWIRYTYDFGDDWEHKIVYEKDDPEYDEDYAQIIKYRGDDFEEDSGGVWHGKYKPFSLELANKRLKNYSIFPADEEDSKLTEKYETLHDFIHRYFNDESMRICRGKDVESISELLPDEAAMDYYRMLVNKNDKDISIETKKQAVVSALLSNPKYFPYILRADALEFLQKTARTEQGSEIMLDAPSGIFTALFTGFLDVTYTDSKRAEFHFAKDVVPALLKLRPAEYKKTDRKIEQATKRILVLLRAYGLIEIDDLIKKYTDIYPEDKKTDISAVVNIHLHVEGLADEYNHNTGHGIQYDIGLHGIDPNRYFITKWRNDMYYVKVDEKVFTRSEIRDSIYGKDTCGKLWSHLDDIVKDTVNDIAEFDRKVESFLISVPEYDEMSDIFGDIYEDLEDNEKVDFWYTLINLMLNKNMPVYHGYSLIEYASKVHSKPFDVLKRQSDKTSEDSQKTLLEISSIKARNAYECIENKDMDKAKKFSKYKDDRSLIYHYLMQK